MRKKNKIALTIIVLIIMIPVGYALSQSLPNILTGYTQVKVDGNGYSIAEAKIGEYRYYFIYTPSRIFMGMQSKGSLIVWRQDVSPGDQCSLDLNVTHTHYGIEFKISEVHPDYCIVLLRAKSIVP